MPKVNTSSRELIDSIDSEQARLRALLSGRDAGKLAIRTANGDWSVIEHVRHLLFAEQLHFGRLLGGPVAWSPLGFAHDGLLRKFPLVNTATPANVSEVLAAWQEAHRATPRLAERDSEAVREVLAKHLRHLRSHVDIVERQVRKLRA